MVVNSCGQLLEMLSWLEDPDSGVTVCKIKNRYATDSEVLDGCVHLSLLVCGMSCDVCVCVCVPVCICVFVFSCVSCVSCV